jgi:glutamate decarboxylase
VKRVQRDDAAHAATYSDRLFSREVPKHSLPETSMPADAAYRLVADELNLDGNPALNLASFVTTWMEPEADRLGAETANRNLIDQQEYPRTQVIHERVVSMVADLFNAPEGAVGTATEGSSEAIMLALLAHKWRWRERRRADGKPAERPNVVIGADVHTCWEKFTRYFEVEARIAPMEPGHYTLSAADVESRVDENTIAVGCILGTTFTGQIDDIEGIDALLVRLEEEKGWDIPIHVDAASGGFIAPFAYPDLEWDFRRTKVRSINVSNHKFGLVYPGLGTVVFRHKDDLPEELVFDITYLGGNMPNYSLNFSRSATPVLQQYYNFLRLGREGYGRVMANVLDNARYLEERLADDGRFELLTDPRYLPVVVVTAKDPDALDVHALSAQLAAHGWIVPAYTLPPNAEHVDVLRMVVKENFSRDMAELLAANIDEALRALGEGPTDGHGGGPDRPNC